MTPGLSPRARTLSAKSEASATVATIGAITHVSVPVRSAASLMPSSWRSIRPGLPKDSRRPRTPSAGFSSPGRVAKAIGLSEPASRVRITTCWPSPKAPSTCA